jgi:hypothetical protein
LTAEVRSITRARGPRAYAHAVGRLRAAVGSAAFLVVAPGVVALRHARAWRLPDAGGDGQGA